MVVGIAEAFVLLGIFFGASFGLPMGVAPGPEDPMMFKIAPENCVFYSCWMGIGELDGEASPTEAWMAQPEIQVFMDKFRIAFRGSILDNSLNEKDNPAKKAMTHLFTGLAETVMRNPAAFYITDFEIIDDSPALTGAGIVGLGEQTDRIEKLLNAFETELKKFGAEKFGVSPVEVDGQPAFRWMLPDSQTEVTFGLRGKYFVFGMGKDSLSVKSLSELAQNSKTESPKWLVDSREELPIERFSSMAFLDTDKAIDLVKIPDGGMFQIRSIFDQVIGDDVAEIVWVSGLDNQGFLTRTSFHTAGELTGILATLNGAPLSIKQLDYFPADATVGGATRFSTKKLLKMVEDIAKRTGQEEAVDDAFAEFQNVTGMKLKDEFLQAIGNYVYFYYKLDIGRPTAGWVASIHIEDEMSFPAIFKKLNRSIEESIEEMGGRAKFETKMIGENEFYTFRENAWAEVTWGLIDDQWYFAKTVDDITAHLAGQPKGNRLSENPQVVEMFEFGDKEGYGNPIAVFDFNLPSLLKGVWMFTTMIDKDEPMSSKFDLRFRDVPELEVLIKGVQPNIAAVYRTENGFQLLQRQTYPSASPSVTVVAGAMIGLPYLTAQYEIPETADVGTVKNKLRQLALASLNFEFAHEKFPAAFTTDLEGRPLLSWRVHVLPFLENQNHLYEQFHLDEPWDSEHNKTLIEKMPDVFKHPGLELGAGKTVYLANAGEGQAFSKPSEPGGKNSIGSTAMGQIRDGTSSTAMIFEVNADHAVAWTKPQDLPEDSAGVATLLKRIRDDDQFVVVLCDGSAHLLGAEDMKTLQAILTLNGGEIVRMQ